MAMTQAIIVFKLNIFKLFFLANLIKQKLRKVECYNNQWNQMCLTNLSLLLILEKKKTSERIR